MKTRIIPLLLIYLFTVSCNHSTSPPKETVKQQKVKPKLSNELLGVWITPNLKSIDGRTPRVSDTLSNSVKKLCIIIKKNGSDPYTYLVKFEDSPMGYQVYQVIHKYVLYRTSMPEYTFEHRILYNKKEKALYYFLDDVPGKEFVKIH